MNRRNLFIALVCAGIFAGPISAFAHGGVEKVVGDTIIFLNQTPLSPFVGEQVHLPFVFTNSKTDAPLSNLPVEVTVTDTFLGDESKDTIIYSAQATTDVNGVLDFSYAFSRENYFDIDLHFTDASGMQQETGFLVQARERIDHQVLMRRELAFLVSGIVVGVLITHLYISTKIKEK
ncbi:MAG: hypothetical protein K8Q97_01795 [Candidatus Andersenbacteria bacterium]|nr:hypothetical protein [Candidatus Andersenbacteria bacterium]